MELNFFKRTRLGIAAGMMTVMAATVAKAEFPERTIENIFPWPPSIAMSTGQIIAKEFSEILGVSVPLISTPGAGGTKAFKTGLGRPADGYTIIDGWVAPLVLQPVLGNADWSYKDFTPLHSGVSTIISLGLRADDDRWDTLEEMMEYGKANPGKLRYSSGVRGNLPHMVFAKLLQSYGVVAQIVPYPSDADARKDLLAGVIDFTFVNVGAYKADKDAFKIALVVSDTPESKALYDGAPNLNDIDIDLGLSGLAPMGWNWWLVRKETPQDRVDVLRAAMREAMTSETVKEQIEAMGWSVLPWDHDQYEEVVGPVAEQLAAMQNAIAWEKEELAKLRK